MLWDLYVPAGTGRVRDEVSSPSACLDLRAVQEHPGWMRGGVKERMAAQRAGEDGGGWLGGPGGREDERWLDALSFDPSLTDTPFNVLTETTWGTPREAACLFISARGEGYHSPIEGRRPHSLPH